MTDFRTGLAQRFAFPIRQRFRLNSLNGQLPYDNRLRNLLRLADRGHGARPVGWQKGKQHGRLLSCRKGHSMVGGSRVHLRFQHFRQPHRGHDGRGFQLGVRRKSFRDHRHRGPSHDVLFSPAGVQEAERVHPERLPKPPLRRQVPSRLLHNHGRDHRLRHDGSRLLHRLSLRQHLVGGGQSRSRGAGVGKRRQPSENHHRPHLLRHRHTNHGGSHGFVRHPGRSQGSDHNRRHPVRAHARWGHHRGLPNLRHEGDRRMGRHAFAGPGGQRPHASIPPLRPPQETMDWCPLRAHGPALLLLGNQPVYRAASLGGAFRPRGPYRHHQRRLLQAPHSLHIDRHRHRRLLPLS